MTNNLTYKIIKDVGEETAKGNAAFDQLEEFVNEHIREGWQPVGAIAVSSVAGPRTADSTRENWYARVAQALVRASEV
jgi:hypothetical protein